ncbi:DNA protecting protein DprA [Burkholderia sp. Ch1-1]|uniref:DNA protecting protein DprA n=1 Tax=Paraburkholderia dioscoreae TaxID=2604047 RepID=A0A5Q4Z8G3_9BURK|nr:DNA-processing protein DprA [Paraburkholderia dioscoreae]EIF28960.1 DNA protecting protein DprA [Burkholderia sp. Ch1-1]VVD26567.1 DNA protecting protein DprA [Paraburkholderia dioscoreae]
MHTLPATDIELAAWLRLSLAPGLKPAALRLLLCAFGLPEAIFDQAPEALAAIAGDAAARAALAPTGPEFDAQLDAVIAWREQPGNQIVTLDDPAYPPALLTMPDPPPLLYIKGRLNLLHTRAVALVGSRSATPQGVEDAERFARELSVAGVTVVSGLALGIDGAAHRGGLEGVGGTVAVIGTGADLVYPSAHHALARQIAVQGAILSEWPLGTPARAANFPQRNRLIAGLVSGVVIVEAAMRSGSLITARLANEMGRDIFALPGSIHAPLSRGCHRIIKQGAKLVETPDEVLEELGFTRREAPRAASGPAHSILWSDAGSRKAPAVSGATAVRPKPATAQTAAASAADSATAPNPAPPRRPVDPEAERLLTALGHSPTTLEILATRTEMEDAALQSTLLQLELAGQVTVLPGGRFMRASHG